MGLTWFLLGALLSVAAATDSESLSLSSSEIDAFVPKVGLPVEDERTVDEVIRDAGTAEGAAYAAGSNQFVNVEMDMNMDPLQYELFYKNVTGFAGAGMANDYWRWPKGVIPYVIDNVFRGGYRDVIFSAMKEWQEKTCIRFEPAGSAGTRNLGHRDYIRFINGQGCYSMVGWTRGGHQVSLQLGGCTWHSTALHEIGHTIGLHHEQCRTDRDDAIVVQLNNVQSNQRFNFNKMSQTTNFGMPYDYCSIMHYGAYAFSYNRRMTVITRNQDFQFSIGAEKHLTFTDERIVNTMYRCNSHCTKDDTCKEPCYKNHKCACICPKPCPRRPCTSRLNANSCADLKRFLGGKLKTGDYGNGVPPGDGNTGGGDGGGGDGGGETGGGGDGGDGGVDTGNGPNCKNYNERCQEWADRGECSNNGHYMIPNCPKACGFCENCRNQNERCQEWADRGECDNNPWYMLPNCNKACQLCN